MQVQLINIGGKNPSWLEDALAEYDKKIGFFFPFTRKTLKSKSSPREDAAVKKTSEAKELLSVLPQKALVVLLDEAGKSFKSSPAMAAELEKIFSGSKNEVIFLIGGAYGVDAEVRVRADAVWSLSGLTFNHHLVQLVFCEQLYRGLTIWKGIPYHN